MFDTPDVTTVEEQQQAQDCPDKERAKSEGGSRALCDAHAHFVIVAIDSLHKLVLDIDDGETDRLEHDKGPVAEAGAQRLPEVELLLFLLEVVLLVEEGAGIDHRRHDDAKTDHDESVGCSILAGSRLDEPNGDGEGSRNEAEADLPDENAASCLVGDCHFVRHDCAYLGHIGADIRACDLLFLRCACPTSLLGFFYIFEPGSLLCLCWFFTLRNIEPVFRLKYVSLNMFGL